MGIDDWVLPLIELLLIRFSQIISKKFLEIEKKILKIEKKFWTKKKIFRKLGKKNFFLKKIFENRGKRSKNKKFLKRKISNKF